MSHYFKEYVLWNKLFPIQPELDLLVSAHINSCDNNVHDVIIAIFVCFVKENIDMNAGTCDIIDFVIDQDEFRILNRYLNTYLINNGKIYTEEVETAVKDLISKITDHFNPGVPQE